MSNHFLASFVLALNSSDASTKTSKAAGAEEEGASPTIGDIVQNELALMNIVDGSEVKLEEN